MTPSLDNILLKFETALQEKLELKNGGHIFLASWLNKEEYASVVSEVHSLGPTCKLEYALGQVEPGDTVACSYHVVARHTLSADGVTTYHNCYRIGNEKLWLAGQDNIMAVLKNGKWYGVNDWILMKEVLEKPLTSSLLELPESTRIPVLRKGVGEYVSGELDAVEGEHVVFNESYRSVYRVGNEKFIILRKDRIEAKLKTA